MTAVLWVILSIFLGHQLAQKLLGPPDQLLQVIGSSRTASTFFRVPWPSLLFTLAFSTWSGLLSMTWLTYLLAALAHALLPDFIHPLLIANLILLSIGAVWAGIHIYRRKKNFFSSWPSLLRTLKTRSGFYYFTVTIIWTILSAWLMTHTFHLTGLHLHAGYSVFSDFAPHTALVSSFSQGVNWPTQYPHFAHDGISYHFMFYFLCGNLNFLGLPIDWAINLPSVLAFVTFCVLLGLLAFRLTGRPATFFLAPFFLFFRSSMAFFTHLQSLIQAQEPSSFKTVLSSLWNQNTFIGNTPKDTWGLWGINVYANQRHLLSGLSVAIMILVIVLPDLQVRFSEPRPNTGFIRQTWYTFCQTSNLRRTAAAIILCVLMPYWHGSVLVALLLILIPMALFSVNRLSFLFIGISSLGAALIQSWFFSGQASRVIQPEIYFGFIAPDPSWHGILVYLLTVTGIAFPLAIIAFFLKGQRRKILIIAFLLPLIFAFTVSLTPDVTVNHKYIIISLAFLNIYLADLIARLWSRPIKLHANTAKTRLSSGARRGLAVVLCIFLTITGVHEWIIVRNINQNTVSLNTESPLVNWIRSETEPDAVFLSAPYHYHAFFLSGRYVFLGHAYYPWSAGHDTIRRSELVSDLLAGYNGDLEAARKMIQDEKLDYLLLDDMLRYESGWFVDEAFFDRHFPVIHTIPSLGHLKIYDLKESY